MSIIQVLKEDGFYAPLDEQKVREMLNEGVLGPETLYWKEGMTEWRPLKELPLSSAGSSLQPEAGLQRYRFTKDPEPLTTIVKVMLVVSLLAAILNLFSGIEMLINTLARNFKNIVLDAHWMQIFGYSSVVIYLLTAIPFLMWVYRANLNCRGFAGNLKFTPGMAAGGYFIPFANLVYPCEAMQEIWKVSSNPVNWQRERASVLVGFWWGFWLFCGILGQVLFYWRKTHVGDSLPIIISTLQNVSSILIVLEISKIILCLIAFAMIHGITQNQKKLTEYSRA